MWKGISLFTVIYSSLSLSADSKLGEDLNLEKMRIKSHLFPSLLYTHPFPFLHTPNLSQCSLSPYFLCPHFPPYLPNSSSLLCFTHAGTFFVNCKGSPSQKFTFYDGHSQPWWYMYSSTHLNSHEAAPLTLPIALILIQNWKWGRWEKRRTAWRSGRTYTLLLEMQCFSNVPWNLEGISLKRLSHKN